MHDLAESEKHCKDCGQPLRRIAEETSERYEYIPASMKVIEDVCLKYACACTVKTASKPPQPIQKSTAGASLLAQVIVAKWADHQPLHRQEKIWERHGVEISRKTMGGWMAQCARLLDPLYQAMKKELFGSKAIGTDDTSVKVLRCRKASLCSAESTSVLARSSTAYSRAIRCNAGPMRASSVSSALRKYLLACTRSRSFPVRL